MGIFGVFGGYFFLKKFLTDLQKNFENFFSDFVQFKFVIKIIIEKVEINKYMDEVKCKKNLKIGKFFLRIFLEIFSFFYRNWSHICADFWRISGNFFRTFLEIFGEISQIPAAFQVKFY